MTEKVTRRVLERRANGNQVALDLNEVNELFELIGLHEIGEIELMEQISLVVGKGLHENAEEIIHEGYFFPQEIINQLIKSWDEATDLDEEIKLEESEQNRPEPDDIIGLYLEELRGIPLLKTEEEVELGTKIQVGQEWLVQVLDEKGVLASKLAEIGIKKEGSVVVGWPKILVNRWMWKKELKPEEFEILEVMQLARDEMASANTRLVVSIAKRYLDRGIPFGDLIQEGNLGLMRAIDKFDPERGNKFSTYATWWIRQTISRSLFEKGKTIRVPFHKAEQVNRLRRVSEILEQELGREPTIEEIALKSEISPEKVERLFRISISQQVGSLDRTIGDDGTALKELIEDTDAPSPPDLVAEEQLREQLEDILDKVLTYREATILRLRMGTREEEAHTLEEVAKKFGLTRERIRQLQVGALRKLRNSEYSGILKDYLIDGGRN